METDKYKVAIVGGGPRGLSSLESLIEAWIEAGLSLTVLSITIFDHGSQFAHGPNHHVKQHEACWINISERDMNIPGREGRGIIRGFPSYHEWGDVNLEDKELPDQYPPRSKLGHYLQQRYQTIADELRAKGILNEVDEKVIEADISGSLIILHGSSAQWSVNEVMLSLGHLPIAYDDQLKRWLGEENYQTTLFPEPYPVERILKNITGDCNIAMRGYGLSMIDVARAIALDYGEFILTENRIEYIRTQQNKVRLIPFSKDGKPVVPKPINAAVDMAFALKDAERQEVIGHINDIIERNEKGSAMKIVKVIAKLSIDKYLTYNKLDDYDQSLVDDLALFIFHDKPCKYCLSNDMDPYEYLHTSIGMAEGTVDFTLDYLFGQIWRHLHPNLYKILDHSSLRSDEMTQFIEYDEAMKRYTYGPPVESIKQLLALVDADVLVLAFLDDPQIDYRTDGWALSQKAETIVADIMINTVLAAPNAASTTNSVVQKLISNHDVSVYPGFGIKTRPNGLIEGISKPIAIYGRLNKGSVLGTDAILECFNQQPKRWAEGVTERFSN